MEIKGGKYFMKKSIGALALSTGVLSGVFALPAATGAEGTGDLNVLTQDVPTIEQKKVEKEKEKQLKEFIEQRKETEGNPSAVAGGYYKTIAVPSFEQATNYYCAPATVKQVLHFFNGTSSTQGTYATKLGTSGAGTDFSVVDNVLNSLQSKNTFVYKDIGTYLNWGANIDLNLQNNFPTVLDLTISPANMPKYTIDIAGHILNVSGSDTTKASPLIRLTDPFDQGNRGVTLGNVWHPHNGVYKANASHFRRAIIW